MLIIGLTGSIATGKSTVSNLLSKPPYSLPIIDADVLAREVVEPGTSGYKKIVAHFGDAVLLAPSESTTTTSTSPSSNVSGSGSGSGSGSDSNSAPSGANAKTQRPLDRAALGRLVFSSSASAQANRKVLNSIVHPAVRMRMASLILRAYLTGHWAVVLDVPLLFESGLDIFCGSVLLVGISDAEVQLQRLLARDQAQGGTLSEEEARGRVESQGLIKWKVSRVEARREVLGERAAEAVWNDSSKDELERAVAGVVGRWRRASPRWWCWLLWGLPPLALGMAAWWFVRGWMVRKGCLKREQQDGKKV